MNSAEPRCGVDSPLAVRFFLTTEKGLVTIQPGQEIALRRSDPSNELVLIDPSITREPGGIGKFTCDADGLRLTPNPAGNPILVNGAKITEPVVVHAGDRIRVGYSVIVVQAVDRTAEGDAQQLATVAIKTAYVRERDRVQRDVDRLAQWSESFDAIRSASNDREAAEIILPQMMRLGDGDRAVLAMGLTEGDNRSCRCLDARGLHGGEIEQVLHWFIESWPADGVQMPLIKEVLPGDLPGRAAVGRLTLDDQFWLFYLEPGVRAPVEQIAHRALAMLANLLQLYHLIHEGRHQKKRLDDLTAAVRQVSRPPEAQDFEIVRRKFVYSAAPMHSVCQWLTRAAVSTLPVLLLGEPGTGKELAAEAIHAASLRRHRPMVSVNLTEFPEALVESALFGHKRGAFTGATSAQVGLVAEANQSTLFLDEVGEIPLPVQAKLLRVLERGEFRRLGEHELTRVDIRIVSATNRDLAAEVKAGRFRQDLYDRLNVIPIVMPSLRDRLDDLSALATHFLKLSNAREGKDVRISDEGLRHLRRYAWPDNVRGLRHYIERTVALADPNCRTLGPDEMPPFSGPALQATPVSQVEQMIADLRKAGRNNQARILSALQETPGRLTKGALTEMLGMSRPVCRSELRKLIAYALANGLAVRFFEDKLSLRPEDWEGIQSLQNEE